MTDPTPENTTEDTTQQATRSPAQVGGVVPTVFTHRQIMVILSGLMTGMLLAALDQTIGWAPASPCPGRSSGGSRELPSRSCRCACSTTGSSRCPAGSAVIAALPPAIREPVVSSFVSALSTVFLSAVPTVVVAFALTWFLKEIRLRERHDKADRPVEPAAST